MPVKHVICYSYRARGRYHQSRVVTQVREVKEVALGKSILVQCRGPVQSSDRSPWPSMHSLLRQFGWVFRELWLEQKNLETVEYE